MEKFEGRGGCVLSQTPFGAFEWNGTCRMLIVLVLCSALGIHTHIYNV